MTIKGMIAKLRRAIISQRVSTGIGTGGGGGTNNYVAEDGVSPYVAENGSDNYVTET